MLNIRPKLTAVDAVDGDPQADPDRLNHVFFALSDPVRRSILERLDGPGLLVTELAAPFDISLQAVSRHIQVLVRAGLVQQARSGRINKCSLDVGPLFEAAVWMNRYSKYWQSQFDLLAATLSEIDERRVAETPPPPSPPAEKARRKPTRKPVSR